MTPWTAGRLQTRTWSRLVTTTYAYDNAGALSAVSYNDSTPALGYSYDRLGRQIGVTNGMAVTLLSYNDAGQLLAETNSAGLLAGLALASGYDQLLRRTSLTLQQSGNPLIQQSFGFDAASRLLTVNDGNNNTATYSYLANSPLVSQIAFANNGTTRMTTTKQYRLPEPADPNLEGGQWTGDCGLARLRVQFREPALERDQYRQLVLALQLQ